MRLPQITRIAALAMTVLAVMIVVSACVRETDEPTADVLAPRHSGGPVMIDLTSSAFASGGEIPAKYATRMVSGGLNVSIPYTWSDPPSGTKSLALALVDRAPVANNWVHWLVVDVPPSSRGLAEGASETTAMPRGSRELDNGFRTRGYGGPEPPLGSGRHPYEATIYALDVATLDLPQSTSLSAFEARIQGHVLAQSSITGRFGR